MAQPPGSNQEAMKRLQVMLSNFLKIDDGTLSTDVNLRKYGIEAGEPVTNAVLQELCIIHRNIRTLDLSNCKLVTDIGLWAIAKHSNTVVHLILQSCNMITSDGVRALSLKCNNLISLDVSYCTLVDDISLTVIAAGSWRLEKINLTNCYKITDNGVNRLATGLGSCIKILDCRGCVNVGEFGDRALVTLGGLAHELKELYFSDAKRIEDGGLNALMKGCPVLQVLMISGCDNITRKSFKPLCKFITQNNSLHTLKLVLLNKIKERDFECLYSLDSLGNIIPSLCSLTDLEFNQCKNLNNKCIDIITKAVGANLMKLSLTECSEISDHSSLSIAQYCVRLRELNLNYTPHVKDFTVNTIASHISCLTCLRLEDNQHVSTKCLLRNMEKKLEFVEIATQWYGYSPKPNVEHLITAKEVHVLHTFNAIKIQSIIRRKFATKRYWQLHLTRLVAMMIPIFQARVRGYFQRKRFRIIQYNLYRIRMIIRIQCKWRNFYALHERIKIVKKKRLYKLKWQLALLIQKHYRGMKAKIAVNRIRLEHANQMLLKGQTRANREMKAMRLQTVWRGYYGRMRARRLHKEREARRARQALEEKCCRFIQRIGWGCIGRIRARQRRWEIANFERRWNAAREIQRVFRGHQGRLRFDYFAMLFQQQKENDAATEIQRVYRGYRGKLLSAVARALRILRIKQHYFAVEIQRTMRGCVGRHHYKVFKEIETRRRVQVKSAIEIQRIFRGHKGREARLIEEHLMSMESSAKPLILHLKRLEETGVKLAKQISSMEFYDKYMSDNLHDLALELEHCLKTTSKYTDSTRINGIPQRFQTAFLKIRLKDHLDHETETHRVKFIELQKRRAEMRDLKQEIDLAKRELVPLTTGLIADVNRKRGLNLRQRVLARKESTIKIQALWRRALVRKSLYDEYKLYWEKRIDKEQSDRPYYLNTMSREILWKKPLAYNYFARDMGVRDENTGAYATKISNEDKLFGTSNVSVKLRNSIRSAKIISNGASRSGTAGSFMQHSTSRDSFSASSGGGNGFGLSNSKSMKF